MSLFSPFDARGSNGHAEVRPRQTKVPRASLLRIPVFTTLFVLLTFFGALHGALAHPSIVLHRDPNDAPTVKPPSFENFVVKGLAGQPPQTRYYDFVVSQMTGAPDGFSKSMLVVNGALSLFH